MLRWILEAALRGVMAELMAILDRRGGTAIDALHTDPPCPAENPLECPR